jgi:hypothetical protein
MPVKLQGPALLQKAASIMAEDLNRQVGAHELPGTAAVGKTVKGSTQHVTDRGPFSGAIWHVDPKVTLRRQQGKGDVATFILREERDESPRLELYPGVENLDAVKAAAQRAAQAVGLPLVIDRNVEAEVARLAQEMKAAGLSELERYDFQTTTHVTQKGMLGQVVQSHLDTQATLRAERPAGLFKKAPVIAVIENRAENRSMVVHPRPGYEAKVEETAREAAVKLGIEVIVR